MSDITKFPVGTKVHRKASKMYSDNYTYEIGSMEGFQKFYRWSPEETELVLLEQRKDKTTPPRLCYTLYATDYELDIERQFPVGSYFGCHEPEPTTKALWRVVSSGPERVTAVIVVGANGTPITNGDEIVFDRDLLERFWLRPVIGPTGVSEPETTLATAPVRKSRATGKKRSGFDMREVFRNAIRRIKRDGLMKCTGRETDPKIMDYAINLGLGKHTGPVDLFGALYLGVADQMNLPEDHSTISEETTTKFIQLTEAALKRVQDRLHHQNVNGFNDSDKTQVKDVVRILRHASKATPSTSAEPRSRAAS